MSDALFTGDMPRYTQRDATALVIYHLQMAAVFFEISDQTLGAELRRIARRDTDKTQIWEKPAAAWLDSIRETYTKMECP